MIFGRAPRNFANRNFRKILNLSSSSKEWVQGTDGVQEKLRLRGCCGIRRLPARLSAHETRSRWTALWAQRISSCRQKRFRKSKAPLPRSRGKAIGENMDLGLKGKLAVVSGSTAGFGFAIGEVLPVEGA